MVGIEWSIVLGLRCPGLASIFYTNSHSSAVQSFFFRLMGKVYESVKDHLEEEESCAGMSGGKYDSYYLNRGRLERSEAGEANLEVPFHLRPVCGVLSVFVGHSQCKGARV